MNSEGQKNLKEFSEFLLELKKAETDIKRENNYLVRYFLLYVEGSYIDNYLQNLNYCRIYFGNHSKMRGFVINMFKKFVKVEFIISDYAFNKCFRRTFNTKKSRENLNDFLIKEVLQHFELTSEENSNGLV